MIEFFMTMIPPTTTQQEHKVTVRNGKPYFYEPEDLKAARSKLEAHLSKYAPAEPLGGALQLCTKWCFPIAGTHFNGEYKISAPDTDNLQKMLKDVMTRLCYWADDAQVASEISEKFWAQRPGIYVAIREMDQGGYHDD